MALVKAPSEESQLVFGPHSNTLVEILDPANPGWTVRIIPAPTPMENPGEVI
jgi:hypothetical protein